MSTSFLKKSDIFLTFFLKNYKMARTQ